MRPRSDLIKPERRVCEQCEREYLALFALDRRICPRCGARQVGLRQGRPSDAKPG